MESDRGHVVAKGFLALLASQIGTRLVTFTINLLIARHLTPDAYGLSSVQFHLLTTTALFISREGFRRGCLRFGASAAASGTAVKRDGAASGDVKRDDGDPDGADTDGGGGGGGVDDRSVLRVAVLTVPLGLLVTVAVCAVALWRHDVAVAAAAAAAAAAGSDSGGGGVREPEVPYYREAVVLHGVAAVLELLAEPFYILASVHLMFGPRVAVEFLSTLTKSLVTLGLLTSRQTLPRLAAALPPALRPHLQPLLATAAATAAALPPALLFSAAQLAMAAVVAAGYWALGLRLLAARSRSGSAKLGSARGGERRGRGHGSGAGDGSGSESQRPGGGGGGGWLAPWTPLERRVLGTSAIFTLQAVEKLALAEGSKLVLASLQSAVNQGVYGLVSNLGSLVVRTLFQPLEEAAFAAFSTWGAEAKAAEAAAMTHGSATAAAVSEPQPGAGKAAAEEPPTRGSSQRLASLARALSPMVKAVAVLGLAAAAFGPSYSYVLLRLVYGVRWSETEAPAVLAAYSVYVLLLALNGIGEAFVHAVLDARGLQQSNALLLVFSGAHLAVCVALVRQYGALGLVAADGANMVLRIAYSAW
ncbi:hypothetical protein PLESTF_000514400 [Pleodorina starrii]|nr:hypothetical protein PLESTF_000514400 [Pleodorina starrii]